MARIDLADGDVALGSRIAEPQRPVMPRAQDFGGQFGAAVEDVGNQMMAQQRQQQAEQRMLDRQAAAEARAQQREANRVKALTATATVKNRLTELTDQISAGLADGSISKEDAPTLFKERSSALTQDALAGVDQEHRDLVQATLLDDVGRTGHTVGKLVQAKTKDDIRQGTAGWLEAQQRYAARGGKQADEAIAAVEAYIPTVAGMAGLDAAKTVQAFKENARYRQAADLVQADPASALRNLRNKDWLADIDPDRRAALMATAESAVIRAQQRAEIDAQRRAREQEQVFRGAVSVFESGRTFSSDYGEQLLTSLKGSPYEPALRQMMQTGPQNVAAATQPVAMQRATLDALRTRGNTEGSNPAIEAEITRREKVLSAVQRAVETDALGAANDYGVLPQLAPLQINDVAGLVPALAQRVSAARTAAVWAGRPVSPLRPAEAEQLTRLLAPLPPDQKATALGAIGAALNDRDQIQALARQVNAKDPALAMAMMYADTRTTKGRNVSEIVLRGQQAARDGTIKEDKARETGWRASIAAEIKDAYYPNDEVRQQMIDASYAVLLGLAADKTPDIARAVRLATGGIREQSDGSKVPLPYGWSDAELRSGLKTYPADRLPAELRAGNVPVSRDEFLRDLPNARLMYAGQGKYTVRAGSAFVTDASGARVVLDFSGSAQ